MEFGQLIEHNMRNIFYEKSYTKFSGETIPRPFSKKWKSMEYLWINNLKFYAVHFIVWQVECYQKILKPRRRPLAIPHISLELVSLPHYLHYF